MNNNTLFRANAHSQYRIQWRAAPARTSEEVCSVLGQSYDLRGCTNVAQVGEFEEMSNNFKVVTHEGQTLVVRCYRSIDSRESDQLELVSRTTEQLRAAGVPVPQIVLTPSGVFFTLVNNALWQVFEFIEGEHYCGADTELVSVAEGIARLHRALASMGSSGHVYGDHERAIDYSRSVIDPDALCSELESQCTLLQGESDAFSCRFNNVAPLLKQSAQAVVQELLNTEVIPARQLIHHDLHPQNTLCSGGQLKALLDFGNLGFGDLGIDVAMALHRFVRQFVVHRQEPWQKSLPTGLKLFVGRYQALNPLSEPLLRLLPTYMKLFLLQKVIGNTRLVRDGRRSVESACAELEKFLILLAEVDLIARYPLSP